MIAENSDPVALTAQADIHRFYIKVIQPALTEFAPTNDIVGGETADLEVFFENARILSQTSAFRLSNLCIDTENILRSA